MNVRKRRAAFQELLRKVFNTFDEGGPERSVKAILEDTKREADSVIAQKIPTQQKALALMRIEKTGRAVVVTFPAMRLSMASLALRPTVFGG